VQYFLERETKRGQNTRVSKLYSRSVNLVTIASLSRGKCGLSNCVTRYLVAMAVADFLVIFFDLILRHIPIVFYMEFSFFLSIPMRDAQETTQRLKTSPLAMQALLEKKVNELKNDFKEQLKGTEEDTSSHVKELDQQLQNVLSNLNREYQLLFKIAVEELKKKRLNDFEQYCEQQMRDAQETTQRLKTSPLAMQALLEKKVNELKNDFKEQLKGTEEDTSSHVKELDQQLQNVLSNSNREYQLLFKIAVEELKKKRLNDFEQYCKQQMRDAQETTQRLKTSPLAMQALLEKKVNELKNDFKEQLKGTEEDTSSHVKELDQQLQNVLSNSNREYQLLFKIAVEELKKKRLNDFEQYCKQQMRDAQETTQRLKTSPLAMQALLEKKVNELKNDFKEQLKGTEEDTSSHVKELDQQLQNVLSNSNREYQLLFKIAVEELKKKRLNDFEQYCKQQMRDAQETTQRLKTSPLAMQALLEKKVNELKNDFKEQLKGTEEDTSSHVKELDQQLQNVLSNSNREYQLLFKIAVEELKKKRLNDFEQYCKQQMRDAQETTQRLKTSPLAMQALLEKKVNELKNDFKEQLKGTEKDTSSHVKELDQQLQNVLSNLNREYQLLFKIAVPELKKNKLKDFNQYCKQQMRDAQETTQRLKTSPLAMQALLEKKVNELKNDFKEQLKGTEEDTSSHVKELDQQLQNVLSNLNREYQLLFKIAVHELKKKRLKDFNQYCKPQMRDAQETTQRLKTSPLAMQALLEKKVNELKNDFKEQLKGTEEDTSSHVKELDQQLQNVLSNLNREYQLLFKIAVHELKKKRLKDFNQYCKQQKQSYVLYEWTLLPFTASMNTVLENEANRILAEFAGCLCDGYPEKESVVAELRKEMLRLI
ncbi:uncharacterized protein LOC144486805, partial [Mustelus asterias]